jgi:DNA-binding transcriptional MerR regulator
MADGTDTTWTLDELGRRVAEALADGYGGPPNGRVRDLPDARTIRYYTTLGLVDRPGGYRGRVALYGRRHLLQLVAIKRLQVGGLTLAEVQARLLGLSPRALEAVARLPRPRSPEPAQPAAADAARPLRADRFWTAAPVEPPTATNLIPTTPSPVQALALADGVTLLLGPGHAPLDDASLPALAEAVRPLLGWLAAQRGEPREPDSDSPPHPAAAAADNDEGARS